MVIIDDFSMLSRDILAFVDNFLRDLCGNELRFGGITVVVSRDFLQPMVVVPSESRDVDEKGTERWVDVNFVDELPINSKLWDDVKVLRISQKVRQREDHPYGEMVLRVGREHFRRGEVLPIDSSGDSDRARRILWEWMNLGNPK